MFKKTQTAAASMSLMNPLITSLARVRRCRGAIQCVCDADAGRVVRISSTDSATS